MAEELLDKSLDEIVAEKRAAVKRGSRKPKASAPKPAASSQPAPAPSTSKSARKRQAKREKVLSGGAKAPLTQVKSKTIQKKAPAIVVKKPQLKQMRLQPIPKTAVPKGYVPVPVGKAPPGWVPIRAPPAAMAPLMLNGARGSGDAGPSGAALRDRGPRDRAAPMRLRKAEPLDMGPPSYKSKVVAGPGCKLLLSNLHYSVNDGDLAELFTRANLPTVSAHVDFDASGRSYGTAAVVLTSPAHARAAANMLRDREMYGQKVVVEVAGSNDDVRLSSGLKVTTARGGSGSGGGRGRGPGRRNRARGGAADLMEM